MTSDALSCERLSFRIRKTAYGVLECKSFLPYDVNYFPWKKFYVSCPTKEQNIGKLFSGNRFTL